MRVVIATSNAHKVLELEEIFAQSGLDVELVSALDLGLDMNIEETGQTFEENAYIKAFAIHEQCGLPTLADDSGLEVDALNGAPGVHSARYAGEGATDEMNRSALSSALGKADAGDSSARFRCVLCYIDKQRTLFGVGKCEGNVSVSQAGFSGFGYDPVFTPQGYSETFAQLSDKQKNSLSHRGAAVKDLVTSSRGILSSNGADEIRYKKSVSVSDSLVRIVLATVQNNVKTLRSILLDFVQTDDDAKASYEAILQTYLFAGFPAALDGLSVLKDVWQSILPDLKLSDAGEFDAEFFESRGSKLCSEIYEGVFEKMLDRLQETSPELAQWMIIEGYGKTLSRPGLDITFRELCIVAVLAISDREQQLKSHVRGALLVGCTPKQILECADTVTEYGTPRAGDLIRQTLTGLQG